MSATHSAEAQPPAPMEPHINGDEPTYYPELSALTARSVISP